LSKDADMPKKDRKKREAKTSESKHAKSKIWDHIQGTGYALTKRGGGR